MAAEHLTITVDMAEARLLLAEVAARVNVLGQEETERRIGCECNEAFYGSLFTVDPTAKGSLRVVPTPEFDRVLLALW